MPGRLLNDTEVARLLGFSRSWMRQQRYRRRKGLTHNFDLDPVEIGKSPRYWSEDVEAWIDLQRERAANGGR